MVYIDSWDEFQKAAEDLYVSSPLHTRYVSAYRHVDGKLILKVTDDRTCLQYKTNQLTDLKKFERLNRSLMNKMQNRAVASEAEATEATSGVTPALVPASAPVPALAASPQLAATPSVSTGPQIPIVVAASSLTPAASPKTGKKKKGKR